jgi:hypothetical protein
MLHFRGTTLQEQKPGTYTHTTHNTARAHALTHTAQTHRRLTADWSVRYLSEKPGPTLGGALLPLLYLARLRAFPASSSSSSSSSPPRSFTCEVLKEGERAQGLWRLARPCTSARQTVAQTWVHGAFCSEWVPHLEQSTGAYFMNEGTQGWWLTSLRRMDEFQ